MNCFRWDIIFYAQMSILLVGFLAAEIYIVVKFGWPGGLPEPPKRREYETTNKKAS